MKSKNLKTCVDSIVVTNNNIVLGSYDHENGKREGRILFLDKNTKDIVYEHSTSGTLSLFARENTIFAANASDVAIYKDNVLVKKIETESLNTSIFVSDFIYVTDISGNLSIYDENLNLIKLIKISTEPLWIVKEIEKHIFVGSEDGMAYCYFGENVKIIGKKRLGILDFVKINKHLYISSYDDCIEVYEFSTFEFIKRIDKIGSAWKIIHKNSLLYCSCIYDGVKIFDCDFNLIKSFPTKTICYGICLSEKELIWASFYEQCLFWNDIDSLL